MSKGKDRMVYKVCDMWADKRNDASKPAGLYKTQKEAESAARGHLQNQGGGELITKGLDGKIRSKDTIASGNDPRSIKDTEN